MKVIAKYFGMIAEEIKASQEVFVLEQNTTLSDFKEMQCQKYPQLKEMSFKIALNMKLIPDKNAIIKNQDEIAFLPPFAGG